MLAFGVTKTAAADIGNKAKPNDAMKTLRIAIVTGGSCRGSARGNEGLRGAGAWRWCSGWGAETQPLAVNRCARGQVIHVTDETAERFGADRDGDSGVHSV